MFNYKTKIVQTILDMLYAGRLSVCSWVGKEVDARKLLGASVIEHW
ncbi:uncharacterized protein METZ01_LOCUS316613 [marine metagenome]|uniref:Uncharacterized protein n=1 Tax=marine metagenome TaxID=408172 RepID=A0A382NRF2_9ZZZZ